MKLSRLGKQMEHLLVFKGGRHSSLELVYHLLTRSTMEQTVLSSVSWLTQLFICSRLHNGVVPIETTRLPSILNYQL